MKIIQPISIWDKGEIKEGQILNILGSNVKLNQSAELLYAIYEMQSNGNAGGQLTGGILALEGEDYQLWNDDSFAWQWVADKLGLTIISDYEFTPEITLPNLPLPNVEDITPNLQ